MRRTEQLICLAGSGGGHIRQILDLEPLWRDYNRFFVSEDTALGRTLGEKHDVAFVRHVALGQARLGAPFKMVAGAIANFFQSARIVMRKRPDVVISTGAGAMFFTVMWARLLGSKIIIIDSMARVEKPSIFARIAGRLAHVRISQSAKAGVAWPGAKVFDSLKVLDKPAPLKEPLVFVTVGATLPFDRLIKLVETVKRKGYIPERVIAQCGVGGYQSSEFDTVETMDFGAVQELLNRADFVVCHAGTGSLVTALQNGCRTIAVPRRFSRSEHYDDHQAEIAAAFEERGLVLTVDSEEDLIAAFAEWRRRSPTLATRDASDMIAFLREELSV